jgi:hypothetical protein
MLRRNDCMAIAELHNAALAAMPIAVPTLSESRPMPIIADDQLASSAPMAIIMMSDALQLSLMAIG